MKSKRPPKGGGKKTISGAREVAGAMSNAMKAMRERGERRVAAAAGRGAGDGGERGGSGKIMAARRP